MPDVITDGSCAALLRRQPHEQPLPAQQHDGQCALVPAIDDSGWCSVTPLRVRLEPDLYLRPVVPAAASPCLAIAATPCYELGAQRGGQRASIRGEAAEDGARCRTRQAKDQLPPNRHRPLERWPTCST